MEERQIDHLHRRKIIYRKFPETDVPDIEEKDYYYYKDGTYQCYELFRSRAKITTFKSLKWHLLVLWYLNSDMDQDDFMDLSRFISDKKNGFTTFSISENHLQHMIYEVSITDLETPPSNKLRKIIFKDNCILNVKDKLKIVGSIIGKSKGIDKYDIYEAMLYINDLGEKITNLKIAKHLNVTERTVYRNINQDLNKEKELLNLEL